MNDLAAKTTIHRQLPDATTLDPPIPDLHGLRRTKNRRPSKLTRREPRNQNAEPRMKPIGLGLIAALVASLTACERVGDPARFGNLGDR